MICGVCRYETLKSTRNQLQRVIVAIIAVSKNRFMDMGRLGFVGVTAVCMSNLRLLCLQHIITRKKPLNYIVLYIFKYKNVLHMVLHVVV